MQNIRVIRYRISANGSLLLIMAIYWLACATRAMNSFTRFGINT